jgi:hypothetical protein
MKLIILNQRGYMYLNRFFKYFNFCLDFAFNRAVDHSDLVIREGAAGRLKERIKGVKEEVDGLRHELLELAGICSGEEGCTRSTVAARRMTNWDKDVAKLYYENPLARN